jgi:two-component system sensor histidine kinase/response regulator
MHKLLVRQIKREFGADEAQLADVCAELKALADGAAMSPAAALVLGGLNGFLGRVDAAYEQSDRDLKLKIRSLELGSQELSQVNERLRDELSGRLRAIQSLRDTANTLLRTMNDRLPPLADDNLESLSALTADLVRQREQSQLELQQALADLANQKFALDQHAIVTVTDAQGVITYANDKFCEISGYARAELLGQNHRMLKSDAHPPEFFAAMWATISSGRVWHGEISNKAKDGHTYWLNASIVPFCDAQGAPLQYIAIRTDITDRKLQELQIQAAEERLRRITNAVPAVVFQWQVGGGQLRYTFLSERLMEIRGLSHEALLADPSLATAQIVEEDRERVRQGVFSAAERRLHWHDEYRIVKPDGAVRWIRGEINPESELAADGSTVSTGIWQDVTQLKEVDARLREVTDTIPVAVFQFLHSPPASGSFLFFSRGLQRISGQSVEAVLADAEQFFALVYPDDRSQVRASISAAAASGAVWSHDFRLLHRLTGNIVWVHGESQLKARPDGSTLWNGFIADVSAAKQASEELRRAKEEAEAANRAKSEFLANMSHEIRTPMNGVIGMTDLVLEMALGDEQREYLQIVKSSSEALLTIINDILDFSKIEAGKLQVEQIPFNPWQTLNDVLKALALHAHGKGLELVSAIAPEVPRRLLGDPGRLRQIIVNLAGNAIKFTARGEVVLRVEREPDCDGKVCLHFWITDSGIGISAEKLATIFEAFAQEDSSITREYGGTGLGLTISSRLVEIFGGKLRVESQSGQGSTFHFTSLFAPDTASPEPERETVSLASRRLLLVDDNQSNRQVMAQVLGEAGAEVVEAASGEAALAALDRLPGGTTVDDSQGFDLIVLDAGMPGLDGLATAERIRERPHLAATTLVLLTSGSIKGGAQRLRALGFAACLAKPVAGDELCLTLRRVLDGQFEVLPQEASGSSAPPAELKPLNILLVEDHLINQKLIILLLERWGHRVTLAENGLQAIETLRLQHFDIVLMDMMMPVMDGLEATRRIRAEEQTRGAGRTPIIAMTANAMRGDRESCLQAGMDGYIAKPIKSAELLTLLQQYAGGGGAGSAVAPPADDESAAMDHVDADFDYAEALRQVDQEMVEISVGIFLKHFPRDLEIIRNGLMTRDAQAVRFVVHALRGNLAMFGGRPAAALAYRLEQRVVQGNFADAEEVLALLVHEVGKLMSVLSVFAETQTID